MSETGSVDEICIPISWTKISKSTRNYFKDKEEDGSTEKLQSSEPSSFFFKKANDGGSAARAKSRAYVIVTSTFRRGFVAISVSSDNYATCIYAEARFALSTPSPEHKSDCTSLLCSLVTRSRVSHPNTILRFIVAI